MSTGKYFPIKTTTACPLKWNWSTIYLNTGITASCHRTAFSELTAENFVEFHNTPEKLEDRKNMLAGNWPDSNCAYCRKIEEVGGVSDRKRHLAIPNLIPQELDIDQTVTQVTPTIVEIYFSNACNLGCLYCRPSLSSTINSENQKFGKFSSNGVELITHDGQFKDLVSYFWQWFPNGFSKVKRLHVAGGEPLIQKEFEKLLDMIEQYPSPQCELNIITNLMIDKTRLEYFVTRTKQLVMKKSLRRVDITCSIDCWGIEQEYVRWGLKLDQWEENFKYLLDQKWLVVNVNQTISALTIKTMPEFLIKLKEWSRIHKIGHSFSGVEPDPSYLKAEIFGSKEFVEVFDTILSLLPQDTDEAKLSYKYMQGIQTQATSGTLNTVEIQKLITFLNEKDRRRGTNWREIFSWLEKYDVV
jgi:organic radical activating enzyme